MTRALTLVLACTLAAAGCGGSDGGAGSGSGAPGALADNGPEGPFFASLPSGAEQLATVCARKSHDALATRLCSAAPPRVTSLLELEHAIGLFDAGAPQFALTGHSTSLVVREVSAINPRAIIFTGPSQAPTTQSNDGSFVADP